MIKRIGSVLVIIIFLLPILAAWYVFFYHNINIKVKNEKTNENKVLITVSKNDIEYQFFQDIIFRVLQIPFNLTHYNVCFRNRTSVVNEDLKTKEYIPVSNINLVGADGSNLDIKPFDINDNDKNCQDINLDKLIVNDAIYSFPIRSLPTHMTFNFDISAEETAHLTKTDKLITVIIFIIAFYGVLALAKVVLSTIWKNLKLFFNIR